MVKPSDPRGTSRQLHILMEFPSVNPADSDGLANSASRKSQSDPAPAIEQDSFDPQVGKMIGS